jgi:hypothetical protein
MTSFGPKTHRPLEGISGFNCFIEDLLVGGEVPSLPTA